MPEFILDRGGREASKRFDALSPFVRGYIEALFFTDASDPDDGDLAEATLADLSPEAIRDIIADCEAFQRKAADLLAIAYRRNDYDAEAAGRDLWYTRNGHGVGFWDRGQLAAGGLGDRLTVLCGWRTEFREIRLYRGDDGKIYLEQG